VATIEERLTALERRVQEPEHGIAPQLPALHTLDRMDGRLDRLEDGQATLVQGQIALIDSQAEVRNGLSALQAAVETLGRRLPPGTPPTGS
jgi:hypothetical protein